MIWPTQLAADKIARPATAWAIVLVVLLQTLWLPYHLSSVRHTWPIDAILVAVTVRDPQGGSVVMAPASPDFPEAPHAASDHDNAKSRPETNVHWRIVTPLDMPRGVPTQLDELYFAYRIECAAAPAQPDFATIIELRSRAPPIA